MGTSFIQKLFIKTRKLLFKYVRQVTTRKNAFKICKYILGVSSKAISLAIRVETGRYPILKKNLANIIEYLIHLKMSKTLF